MQTLPTQVRRSWQADSMPLASAGKEATVRELAGLDREVTPKGHHSAICIPHSMSPITGLWAWRLVLSNRSMLVQGALYRSSMQEQVVAFSVSWEHSDPRLALQVGMLQHTAECALTVTFLQLSRGATEGRTPEVCYKCTPRCCLYILVHSCAFCTPLGQELKHVS